VANRLRGEVELEIAGKTWTLRPSFAAICEIEDQTRMTIEDVFGIGLARNLGVGMTAIIIHAGIRAAHGDDAPSFAELGDALVEHGYKKTHAPLVEPGAANYLGYGGLVLFLTGAMGFDPAAADELVDGVDLEKKA